MVLLYITDSHAFLVLFSIIELKVSPYRWENFKLPQRVRLNWYFLFASNWKMIWNCSYSWQPLWMCSSKWFGCLVNLWFFQFIFMAFFKQYSVFSSININIHEYSLVSLMKKSLIWKFSIQYYLEISERDWRQKSIDAILIKEIYTYWSSPFNLYLKRNHLSEKNGTYLDSPRGFWDQSSDEKKKPSRSTQLLLMKRIDKLKTSGSTF